MHSRISLLGSPHSLQTKYARTTGHHARGGSSGEEIVEQNVDSRTPCALKLHRIRVVGHVAQSAVGGALSGSH